MSVIIDPRRLDAVLSDLEGGFDTTFAARLRGAGVRLDRADTTALVETAGALSVRPGRCAVVTSTEQGVRDARAGGFALVVAVDPAGALRSRGADAVVKDVNDIDVRAGDRRMSELPDGLQALGLTSTTTRGVLRFRRNAVRDRQRPRLRTAGRRRGRRADIAERSVSRLRS